MTDRKISLVTSWSEEGYDLYGRRFMEGFREHWPEQVRLYVYSEVYSSPHNSGNVTLLPMPESVDRWVRKFGQHSKADGRLGFKWNAAKFANKTYSIFDCARHHATRSDYLVWLDGDVVTHSPVTDEVLDAVLPLRYHVASILDRTEFPECGFMAFNRRGRGYVPFLADWRRRYDTGEVLDYEQTHDSYVFKVMLEHWRPKGLTFRSLCPYDVPDGDHVFVNSPLGLCMDHLKGARKYVGSSVVHDLRRYFHRDIPYWKRVSTTTHGELERIKREKGLT